MPSKAACNKIKDPAQRERCLKYQGEFAQDDDNLYRKRSHKRRRGGAGETY